MQADIWREYFYSNIHFASNCHASACIQVNLTCMQVLSLKTHFASASKVLAAKLLAKCAGTLRSSIDYVIEQELRRVDTKPKTSLYCTFCKMTNHNVENCRKKNRNNQNQNVNKTDITCYKCGRKNHYANECRSESNTNGSRSNVDSDLNNSKNQQRKNFRIQKKYQNKTPNTVGRVQSQNVETATQTEENTILKENIPKN